MLGEPNPELEVDATGIDHEDRQRQGPRQQRHLLRGRPVHGHAHRGPAGRATRSPSTTSSTTTARKARFLANDLASVGGPAPDGEIWGRGGVFEFQQTWDFVKLLNASSLNMVTNIIDVVNTNNPPTIEIRVDTIPPGTGSQRAGLAENAPAPSFDFDIKYTFPPTLVQIKNTCPFSCPMRNPFIRLDDYIENPIGKTRDLQRQRRHPLRRRQRDHPDEHPRPRRAERQHRPAEPDARRTRTRRATRSWSSWSGSSTRTRVLRRPGAVPYDFVLTADAGKDVVLDITANRRTDEALGSALTVTIDHINAGDDVDLVVNDSKNGNDLATLVLVDGQPVRPGDAVLPLRLPRHATTRRSARTAGRSAVPARATPAAPAAGSTRRTSGPTAADPNLDHILRAFGTVGDRDRLDLRLPGRPRRRRHRHLPRLDRRRGAEVLRD